MMMPEPFLDVLARERIDGFHREADRARLGRQARLARRNHRRAATRAMTDRRRSPDLVKEPA
jgi:hypothetical protein